LRTGAAHARADRSETASPLESIASQKLALAHDSALKPAWSTFAGSDQPFPFQVISWPRLSAAIQYETVGHETHMPLPGLQLLVEKEELPELPDPTQPASGGSMVDAGNQVPFVQAHAWPPESAATQKAESATQETESSAGPLA
jgi:hypothetical protein